VTDDLTLAEKASLTSGADFWHTTACERAGVPSLLLTDGPHGVRKQASDHAGVDLARGPRGEYLSEDPLLTGELGAALVRGLPGRPATARDRRDRPAARPAGDPAGHRPRPRDR